MSTLKQPIQGPYVLSQNLISQLTVIVICCDLLDEKPPEDPEIARRLHMIRRAARSIAQELGRQQDQVDEKISAITTIKPQLLC